MIHIFVGTKAQFIKMAPIMQELDRRNIPYNFIDAGQHAGITGKLITQFALRSPDVHLRDSQKNIKTLFQALSWTIKSLFDIIFRPKWVQQHLFQNTGGICLIHGDTLTTLLSLLYARRSCIKVAHVEAGLRSYHLLDPFPEELIRLITMRFSDLLFAPSQWSLNNLQAMGYVEKSVYAHGNTIQDSVQFARDHISQTDLPGTPPYVLVTCHRVESIYSRHRLKFLVGLIEQISQERNVLFVLHEPTHRQLSRFELLSCIAQNNRVEMLPLQPYLTFITLIAHADFVITDGGSIQEESAILGVPCLILRQNTERREGLGENARITGFNPQPIQSFLDDLPQLRRPVANLDIKPSGIIVDHITAWA